MGDGTTKTTVESDEYWQLPYHGAWIREDVKEADFVSDKGAASEDVKFDVVSMHRHQDDGACQIWPQPLMLETYPGCPTRRVAYDDLSFLEMIICDVCGYAVSQDEWFDCPTCDVAMCLYCWQGASCPSHGV